VRIKWLINENAGICCNGMSNSPVSTNDTLYGNLVFLEKRYTSVQIKSKQNSDRLAVRKLGCIKNMKNKKVNEWHSIVRKRKKWRSRKRLKKYFHPAGRRFFWLIRIKCEMKYHNPLKRCKNIFFFFGVSRIIWFFLNIWYYLRAIYVWVSRKNGIHITFVEALFRVNLYCIQQ